MQSKVDSATCCGTAMSAQKASLGACPASTSAHKNPDIQPVGSKAMTGARYS